MGRGRGRGRTSPLSIKSMAVPMACVPVAQADTTPKLGPLHLCSMATTPDAVLEMRAGIRKGDTCHTTMPRDTQCV